MRFLDIPTNTIQGVKQLPNGDFLMAVGPSSSSPITGGVPTGSISEIREVNLAGDTVREISVTDLNALLANCFLRRMQGDAGNLPP